MLFATNRSEIREIKLRLSQFAKEIRALGALEFALMVPVLLLLWTGTVELAALHLASRKVTISAQSAADLISQEASVTDATLEDIEQAINAIMAPYPTDTLGITLVSVTADNDGNVGIGWRYDGGFAGGDALGAIPPRAIPLVERNDSVIVAIVTYRHRGVFDLFFTNTEIIEEAFVRPRRVAQIPQL